MKEKIYSCIKIAISFSLIGLIFYIFRDKLDDVVELIKGANSTILCVAFMGSLLLSFLFGLRLKLVLSVQGINISFNNGFVLVMIGYFFNNFIPSSVGADVAKGMYLSRGVIKPKEVFSSILVDRIIGLSTLISIGVIATICNQELMSDKRVVQMIIVMLICAVSLTAFFLNRSLARLLRPLADVFPWKKPVEKVKEFYLAIHGYKKHPAVLCKVIFISFVVQIVHFYVFYLLAYAMGMGISVLMFFSLITVVSLAVVAPSLNGLGVREVLFVYFFSKYCGEDGALAISILMDALFIFLGVVGGVVFAFARQVKHQEINTSEPLL